MDISTFNALGIGDLSSVQTLTEILNFWPIIMGACVLVGLGVVFFQFFTGPGTAIEKKKTLIKRSSTIVASAVLMSVMCVTTVSSNMFESFTNGGVLDSTINSAWVDNDQYGTDLIDVEQNGTKVVSGIKRKGIMESGASQRYQQYKDEAKASGMGSVEAQALAKMETGAENTANTLVNPDSSIIDKAGAIGSMVGTTVSTGTNYGLGKFGSAVGDFATGILKHMITGAL